MVGASLIDYQLELASSEYKLIASVLFLFFALIDVGRDWFGIGRRSKIAMASLGFDPAKIRRQDWVSGKHGDLPDVPIETGPRSGEPEFVNYIDRHHVVRDWAFDPATGTKVRLPGPPTPRSAIRMRETGGGLIHLGRVIKRRPDGKPDADTKSGAGGDT